MATVNVSIEGLGIICFNPGGAEITFLRHQGHGADHHELSLIAVGEDCDFESGDIPVDADIRFEVQNPSNQQNEYKDNNRFDRLSGLSHPNNIDDLNWLVNLSRDFHPTNLRRKRNPQMPLSKLLLPNARFYTERHFTVNQFRRECFLSRRRGEPFDERFGLLGSALGATFSAESVRLLIGEKEVCRMQQDTTYSIRITNIRKGATRFLSDFRMYYHVLAPQDGLEFDFHIQRGVARDDESDEHIQGEAVQHGKSAEIDDLSGFFRSPDPAMCNMPIIDRPTLNDLPPEN
ncbi:MAG TPA: hypothetical protein VF596_17960 [Pyrinomonadaceae bacterium]